MGDWVASYLEGEIPAVTPDHLQFVMDLLSRLPGGAESVTVDDNVLREHGVEGAEGWPLMLRAGALLRTLDDVQLAEWVERNAEKVHVHSDLLHAAAAAPVRDLAFDPAELAKRARAASLNIAGTE